MRLITLVFISVLFLASCSNQNQSNYTIHVKAKGAKDDVAYLVKQTADGKQVKIDSTDMKNGEATFTGTLEYPEFYFIQLKNQQLYLPLFADNEEITATGNITDMRSREVTGSKAQEEFAEVIDSLNTYSRQERQLGMQYQQARQNGDTVLMQELENQYEQINTEKSAYLKDYVISHPKSVPAAFVFLYNLSMYELEDMDTVVSSLDPSIAGSEYVKELTDKVAALKRVSVGQPFTDFTLNDPDGNPVPLSSIAGHDNYVLVDFWASWCQPCRAENPNVVKAYRLYHDTGFDVFGVSFDKEKDKWIQAIKDDSLVWTQVSDLKYWQCEAGKIYGVQAIPHNILIDPNGIIIDKNIRGEELQEKLSSIFNK
jgi:peroxiredoxin